MASNSPDTGRLVSDESARRSRSGARGADGQSDREANGRAKPGATADANTDATAAGLVTASHNPATADTADAPRADTADAPRADAATLAHAAAHANTVTDVPGTARRRSRTTIRPDGDAADREAGRYARIGEYARGGLGRIVEARDEKLGRTVAIKELLAQSAFAESLFIREARITARLQHPGIVPVHEAGRWESGEPYYVMKLVSGRSLRELIKDAPTLDARMALFPHVLAVAEAVAYAHSEQVIHRDIKPANVIAGAFGETVVVDWGLARDRKQDLDEPVAGGEVMTSGQFSIAGKIIGTPAYMAPEQARGDEVDERADVYALGATLYELLTGEAPYAGRTPGVIVERVLAGPPPPLHVRQPDTHPDLLAIVQKAMAREAADRYRCARELAEDLRRFHTGQLVSARQYSTAALVRRWVWRHRSSVTVALIALVALAAFGVVAVHKLMERRDQAQAGWDQAARESRATAAREIDLEFLQAQSSLLRDPTATLAWLKEAPVEQRFASARAMADDAVARGVARHVLRHEKWVMDAAFSPDGAVLATACVNRDLALWDVVSGARVAAVAFPEPLVVVAFSPDGALIAVGGAQGGLWLHEPSSGHIRALRSGHRFKHSSIAFSGDGRYLLAESMDGHRSIWNVATGANVVDAMPGTQTALAYNDARGIAAMGYENGEIVVRAVGAPPADGTPRFATRAYPIGESSRFLEFLPDGRRLISISDRNVVRVIDLDSGEAQTLVRDIPGWAFATLAPSGRWLAVAGRDRVIRVWNLDTMRMRALHDHEDLVHQILFTPDEDAVITAGDEGDARVLDLRTGYTRALRGHTDDVFRIALSPDGRTLATASLDGSARVWALPDAGHRVQISPDGALAEAVLVGDDALVTHAWDGGVRRWSLSSGRSESLGAADAPYYRSALRASPIAPFVATPSGTRGVHLWNVDSDAQYRLDAGDGDVLALAFSPTERVLVTASRAGAVRRWDLDTRAPTTLATGTPAWAIAYRPDGARFAIFHGDAVSTWDASSGRRLRVTPLGVDLHPEQRPGLRYSPDGRWLAVYTLGELVVYDTRTGAVRPVMMDERYMGQPVFSPDSAQIAAGMNDRTVVLWRTADGHETVLRGHQDVVFSVAFTPDGTHLVSASYDRTLRIWDMRDHHSRVLYGHDGSVDAIVVRPGGDEVISVGRDATVRFWPLGRDPLDSPEALRALLRAETTAVIDEHDRPATQSRPAPRVAAPARSERQP